MMELGKDTLSKCFHRKLVMLFCAVEDGVAGYSGALEVYGGICYIAMVVRVRCAEKCVYSHGSAREVCRGMCT